VGAINDSNERSGLSNFPIPIRIVVYPSEDTSRSLIAHCLELDIIGEDATLEGALRELFENIAAQIEACNGYNARLYFPAPASVSEKYLTAKVRGREIPDEMIQRIMQGIAGREEVDSVFATEQVREDYLLAGT